MERTLAVFYNPTPSLRTLLEQALTQAGFTVRAQVDAGDEELEEAGLEPNGKGDEVKHWAVVVEKVDAVKALKDLKGEGHAALNSKALASLFPDLKIHCSPSVSAANMSITTLFPQLGSLPSPAPSPANSAVASSVETTPTPAAAPPKPFALSNLAHPAPLVLNTNAREKQLSPSIERALRDLELKEESRRRKISGGSAASRGSLGVALSTAEQSGGEQEEEDSDEEEQAEAGGRRVFSARSRDTTAEFNVYPDAEDDTIQPPDSHAEDQQEGLNSPAVDEEQLCSPLAPSDSVSLSSTHRLTRQTSTISSASTTSVTSSHRRARSSLSAPAIQPRMTKAAALRLGIPYEPAPMRRKSSVNSVTTVSSSESRVVPTPKSLAAPSIAPRPTKASALRDGTGAPLSSAPTKRRETIRTAERAALDRQRRASVAGGEVSALQQQQWPKVEVRMSKAAMLRQGIELPPSAAAMRRQASESSATSDVSINATESTKAARRQSLSGAIASTAPPKILPRQTKASSLRTGVDSPLMTRGRSASTLEDLREEGAEAGPSAPPMARAKTTTSFEGVPGHKRRESVGVPSLSAPPKIAVRLTKAAALRTGQEVAPSAAMRRQASATSSDGGEGGYEGIPGHKRHESIQVASTAKPKIQPRMSRASMLRLGMEVESPSLKRTSSASTPVDYEGVPGHPRRRESLSVTSLTKPPSITPRRNRSTLLRQASSDSNPSSVSPTLHRRAQSSLGLAPPKSNSARPSSALSSISNLTLPTTASAGTRIRSAHSSTSSHSTPPKPAAAPASAKPPPTPRAPTITPRSNKSAMLRAAKMEAEAAKAKGGAPKTRKAGGPPSLLSGMMDKGRPSTALGLTREVKGSKGSEENEQVL